jgi:hypothetical protein
MKFAALLSWVLPLHFSEISQPYGHLSYAGSLYGGQNGDDIVLL